MKTNDLKRQLAAVMAVALTFSSVPVVSADDSLSFLPADDSMVLPTDFTAIDNLYAAGGSYSITTSTSGVTIASGAATIDDTVSSIAFSVVNDADSSTVSDTITWSATATSGTAPTFSGDTATITTPGVFTITASWNDTDNDPHSAELTLTVLDKCSYAFENSAATVYVNDPADTNAVFNAAITAAGDIAWTGAATDPTLTTDYIYSYSSGTLSLALNAAGQGKYVFDDSASTKCTVAVKQLCSASCSVSSVTVPAGTSDADKKTAVENAVADAVTVTANSAALTKDTDYTVAVSGSGNNYTVTVSLSGDKAFDDQGATTETFTVTTAEAAEISSSVGTVTDKTLNLKDSDTGVTLSCAGAAKWESSNAAAIAVDESAGDLTINTPGSTTIKALDGSDEVIDTITVVVLDEVGYEVSRADGKADQLEVEFGADETITLPNINSKLNGKLKVTLSSNSSVYSLTAEDYTYVVSEHDASQGLYDVKIELTEAGAKKYVIDTGAETAYTVKVKKADTTISKADIAAAGKDVKVTVNNIDTESDKENAAIAAIQTAVKDKLEDQYPGLTVSVTAAVKNQTASVADTVFTVTVTTTTPNYTVEGTADANVIYSNDTVKIVPTCTKTGIGTDAATGNDTYTFNAKMNMTAEGNKNAAIDEIKTKYAFTYVQKGTSTAVTGKTDVQVDTVEYDENSATFTVKPVVLAAETKNYEIVDSQTYTVVVTFAYAKEAITPNFTYKQGGSVVAKTAITVDTAAETAADKEKAAMDAILAALQYDVLAGTAIKDEDYTVTVAPTGDAGTSARENFTVTLTLTNTDSYSLTNNKATDNVTVTYTNTATQERETISPAISYNADGYEIEVPSSATVSAKKKLAKAELAKSVKLTGVDSLTEGVDYKFEIASNAAGTEFTATFTLLTTAKYEIDAKCKPTSSNGKVNDTVSATINVSYKLVKGEVTPVLAAAKDTIVKYINGNESYTTVTNALIADVIANTDNAYYTLTGADALVKGTDYDISVENKGTANKPVIAVKFTLKSTDTYTVADAAVTEISIPVEYAVKTVVNGAFVHWDNGTSANVTEPVTVKISLSTAADAAKKKEAAVKAVKAEFLKKLPGGMVEGEDFTVEFSDIQTASGHWIISNGEEYLSVKIKLLDTDKYTFGKKADGSAEGVDDDGDGIYETQCYDAELDIQTASQVTIVPIMELPKEVTVEVYADDDFDARKDKAVAAIKADFLKTTIYGAQAGVLTNLVEGYDKDYFLNVYTNNKDNPAPTFEVLFELKNTNDYAVAGGSTDVDANTTDSVTDMKTPVEKVTTVVTYKEVEKPDVETDKWVKNEDGTYSYTASKNSDDDNPITEGNLMLDLGEDVDYEKVTNISATISMTGEGAFAGGTLGATQIPDKWITSDWSNEDMTDGRMTVSLDVEGGITSDSAQLQLWWIGKDTTITLDKVEVKTEQAEKAESPEITKVITDREANTIGLNWTKVDGAAGYRVYAKASGAGWTSLATVSGEDSIGRWLRGLDPTKKYRFMVKAYVNGEWTEYDVAKTTVASPCSTKPIITKAAPQTGKIALNWTSTVKATGYGIYVKAEGGKWTRYAMTTGINSTGKWVKLEAGKKYTIAVKAYVNGKWTDVTSKDMVTVTAK